MAKEENEIKDAVRLEADMLDMHLYRNQSGALQNKEGNWIRFGLGCESKSLNKVLKSADLIGIVPVTITEEMVGSVIGVFVSIENKKPGWKYGDTKQDEGQEAWRAHIEVNGGFAAIICKPGQLECAWRTFINKLKKLV